MKLTLNREWFETRIQPNENYEVGAGVSSSTVNRENNDKGGAQQEMIKKEFAESILPREKCAAVKEFVELHGTQDDD